MAGQGRQSGKPARKAAVKGDRRGLPPSEPTTKPPETLGEFRGPGQAPLEYSKPGGFGAGLARALGQAVQPPPPPDELHYDVPPIHYVKPGENVGTLFGALPGFPRSSKTKEGE